MRQTAWRVLVLLACVVSVHCGGTSDATGTAPSTTTGGSGGSGGTSGGGTGGTGGGTDTYRVTLPISDSFFDDNDWDDVVETYGASGGGNGAHLTFNGQAGAGYRQVNIHIDSGGANAQLAVFAIRRDVVYFPSTDGEILWIDYSESSINQSGTAQYSAPALRQNGKLYTLVPGGGAFAAAETTFTDHSLTHLTQSDFRTIASATDHPDFTSGRIEVGFMRLQVGQGTTKSGIDNYRMVLYRK